MTDAKYSSSAPACACGKPIPQKIGSGRPRKSCGPECAHAAKIAARESDGRARQYVRVGVREFECVQCHGKFESSHAKRYCSSYCKERAGHLKGRPGAAARGPLARIAERPCAGCGVAFKPRLAKYGTYCSRACSFAQKAAAPSCTVWASYCLGCGSPFVTRHKRAYCNDGCRPSACYEYISVAPEAKNCRGCGVAFKVVVGGGRPREYCSTTCAMRAAQAIKRIAKSKRRARMRAVTIENVDPFRVFDRDGWRCQLCGVATPKRKRGTYDDDAPELDHIIPLSRGGAHSYLNVQCACRKCNGEKSGEPRGQLLLIG
jgi:5-methylcytosine-specific restriction endonuclease McrA